MPVFSDLCCKHTHTHKKKKRKKSDRLDWMYATSAQASSEVQEEYLLGKRRVDTPGNQTAGVRLLV